MIPRRRMANLITQARAHQYQHCLYHNMPSLLPQLTMPSQASSRALELSHPIKNQNNHGPLLSLFSDHYCDRSCFPRVTSNILGVHTDEVWQIEWSHDGKYLASASKDQTAIIWEVGVSINEVFFHLLSLIMFFSQRQISRGNGGLCNS